MHNKRSGAAATANTNSATFRRLARALAAVGVILAGIGVIPPAASATPTPIEDPRATVVAGNVTTCSAVGYASDLQLGADSSSGGSASDIVVTNDGIYLQVTNGGTYVIDVVIVKGGPAYNVYPGTVTSNLRSPVNGGGSIPAISHWFLCYHAGDPATTTTTGDPATTTTTSNVGGLNDSATNPVVAQTQAARTSASATLPVTGSNEALPLVALGLLLIVAGGLAARKAAAISSRSE